MKSSRLSHIRYGGFVYVRINKAEYQFEGGETNKDLLKLKDRLRPGCHVYFKLRGLR